MPLSPEDKHSIAYDKYRSIAFYSWRYLPAACLVALGTIGAEAALTNGFENVDDVTMQWMIGIPVGQLSLVPLISGLTLIISRYHLGAMQHYRHEDRVRRGLSH